MLPYLKIVPFPVNMIVLLPQIEHMVKGHAAYRQLEEQARQKWAELFPMWWFQDFEHFVACRPCCILLFSCFCQVSLRWWEHLQLPAQPPELNSEHALCCGSPDRGSARVARLPREPVAPGRPQLEGHGEGSLLHLHSSLCSDLMVLGTFCFLPLCRWSDFLSPKLWMTWRYSIWPPYKLWLWVLCFRPDPALSRSPLYFVVRMVTSVCSPLDVFLAARHAPHPRSHEGSRARHQNALSVRRFEQKFPVCADSRKRDRYKELCGFWQSERRWWQLLFLKYSMSSSGLPVVLPYQTEAVLLGASILGACASTDYRSIQVGVKHTFVKVQSKVIQMAVIHKIPIGVLGGFICI